MRPKVSKELETKVGELREALDAFQLCSRLEDLTAQCEATPLAGPQLR